jgi:hypothetical protein
MTLKRMLLVVGLALAPAACGDSDDVGTTALTWTLQDEATGQSVGCASGDVVRVTLGDTVDEFDCAAGAAVTSEVDEGAYDAIVDLVDASNEVRSTVTIPIVINPDLVSDMGNILFLVE